MNADDLDFKYVLEDDMEVTEWDERLIREFEDMKEWEKCSEY